MSDRNVCSHCSKPLLRHLTKNRAYWFCRSCWQETPLHSVIGEKQPPSKFLIEKNAPIRVSL